MYSSANDIQFYPIGRDIPESETSKYKKSILWSRSDGDDRAYGHADRLMNSYFQMDRDWKKQIFQWRDDLEIEKTIKNTFRKNRLYKIDNEVETVLEHVIIFRYATTYSRYCEKEYREIYFIYKHQSCKSSQKPLVVFLVVAPKTLWVQSHSK